MSTSVTKPCLLGLISSQLLPLRTWLWEKVATACHNKKHFMEMCTMDQDRWHHSPPRNGMAGPRAMNLEEQDAIDELWPKCSNCVRGRWVPHNCLCMHWRHPCPLYKHLHQTNLFRSNLGRQALRCRFLSNYKHTRICNPLMRCCLKWLQQNLKNWLIADGLDLSQAVCAC